MAERASTREKRPLSPGSGRVCWQCQAQVDDEHFCPACGKLQPQQPGTDYFSFFGLDRKLALDGKALERRFHQLSWKLHPDNFHNASGYERALSLEKTSALNDAYRTLREPVSRVEYLLGLEGVRREGEVKQQAPPDLLAEVFELNEYLEELRAARGSGGDAGEVQELRQRLQKAGETFQDKLQEVLAELRAQFQEWDRLVEADGDAAARRRVLETMSQILNRHSYIRNLVGNVNEALEED